MQEGVHKGSCAKLSAIFEERICKLRQSVATRLFMSKALGVAVFLPKQTSDWLSAASPLENHGLEGNVELPLYSNFWEHRIVHNWQGHDHSKSPGYYCCCQLHCLLEASIPHNHNLEAVVKASAYDIYRRLIVDRRIPFIRHRDHIPFVYAYTIVWKCLSVKKQWQMNSQRQYSAL